MSDFLINGIVSVRNNQPYIQLANEKGMIAQLTMSQARQIAMDILVMASRTEMDAMVRDFFVSKLQAPEEAAIGAMQLFRDYRARLDAEKVERGNAEWTNDDEPPGEGTSTEEP